MTLKIAILVCLLLIAACQGAKRAGTDWPKAMAQVPEAVSTRVPTPDATADSAQLEKPYPGRRNDEVFPSIAEHSFSEPEFEGKRYSVVMDKLRVNIQNFAPKSISRNNQTLMRFQTGSNANYNSNRVGKSHLLGSHSNEIYVGANNGGICCGEDWIVDITNGKPRIIFHSDDWGYFYGGLEVFDADGDGIYEIVDFDASFRYVASLLGVSSPQPRAVFKYDRRLRRYVPAPELQQGFVKQGMAENEKWIRRRYLKLKSEPEAYPEQFIINLISQVVDLFFQGKERQAWNMLNRYCPPDKLNSIRAELRERVRKSPTCRRSKNARLAALRRYLRLRRSMCGKVSPFRNDIPYTDAATPPQGRNPKMVG
jgi:hypothetical protein